MKKNAIVLIGFTKYTSGGIIQKGNFIVECMTGNVLYTDAGSKLTDVEDAITAYLAVLGKKGKVLNYKELKKAARKVLNDALAALGIYVSEKYPLNVSNWLTSGYDVQTFDGETHAPGIPQNVKAKDTKHTGEALVTYDSELFAEYYEGRNWKQGDPVPSGIMATSRSHKMLFDKMTAGDTWYFQVRARGTKGTSDWCQAITLIVR